MSGLVTAVACAAFDDATDAAVLAVRDVVVRAGVRLPARPRHRPHVTLAAVRVHRDQLDAVVDHLRPVITATSPFRLRLDTVGRFGRAGALWLGPRDEDVLRTLQRSVHGSLDAGPWPAAFTGRTAPADWVPHVTLASRLDRATLERVAAIVDDGHPDLEAVVAGVAVVVVGEAGDAGLAALSDARPSRWPAPADTSK